jgi:succinate dehydrogenase / fumarate reductase iron-sulfur subunit
MADVTEVEAKGPGVRVLREEQGLGLCNITKCCSEVCPAGIKITDNAIIPMRERSADQRYDPLGRG